MTATTTTKHNAFASKLSAVSNMSNKNPGPRTSGSWRVLGLFALIFVLAATQMVFFGCVLRACLSALGVFP